jgi:hypothetical protein
MNILYSSETVARNVKPMQKRLLYRVFVNTLHVLFIDLYNWKSITVNRQFGIILKLVDVGTCDWKWTGGVWPQAAGEHI